MRPPRERVLAVLDICQARAGGYTGEDLSRLARELGVKGRTLRRWLAHWIKEDTRFRDHTYLGQRTIPFTVEDYTWLETHLRRNPSAVRNLLLSEFDAWRTEQGRPPAPPATFYRVVARIVADLPRSLPGTAWLAANGIAVDSSWSLATAREALETDFSFDHLKFHAGISTRALAHRLERASAVFHRLYPTADPLRWYPAVATRAKVIRRQLSSLHAEDRPDAQGRLVFESAATFLVEGYDSLLDEFLLRRGRTQQSRNAAHASLERGFLRRWAAEVIAVIRKAVAKPVPAHLAELEQTAQAGEALPTKTRRHALLRHRVTVSTLWETLARSTDGFAENRLTGHGFTPTLVLLLANDPAVWDHLEMEEKRRVVRDPALVAGLRFSDPLPLKAVILDRLLGFLKSGKITDPWSWRYGDWGARLSAIPMLPVEPCVRQEDIESLAAGKYQFPPVPETRCPDPVDEMEIESEPSDEGTGLSAILDEVALAVAERNPGWFDAHREVFRRQTDGMLEFGYAEEEYRHLLYRGIGFLGRNFRYSDDPDARELEHLLRRYLSDEILDLETRHLWALLRDLLGTPVRLIVIDTMGIDSRRKSFFATLHGRYGTVGFSDLRAIADMLIPVYSTNCRSTDSEAMNIVPVLAHGRGLFGEDLVWYTGNSHTTSRLAAGMAFVAYKVIAAGRVHGEPRRPGPRCLERLREQTALLNRIGQALRQDPSLGRMLASRRHCYVDGVNVRRLLEDLGSLVLWAQREQGIGLDHLSQLIETSNRQKRVVQIVERGVRRVHEPSVSLALKSTDLILVCLAAWRLIRGKREGRVVENPVSLDGVVMFRPA